MATPSRRTARPPLLPEGSTDFLRRRAIELGGLALLAFAVALLLSLLTYSPEDGSLNVATAGATVNLLGPPGAYGADILLQSLGLTAGLLAATGAAWGWRFLRHRGLRRPWLRIALLPVGLFGISVALAALPTPTAWRLEAGLGGLTGQLGLGQGVATAASFALPVHIWMVSLAAAVIGVAAWLGALGIPAAEWRIFGRALGRGLAALWRAGTWATAKAGGVAGSMATAGYRRVQQARLEPGSRVLPIPDPQEDDAAEDPWAIAAPPPAPARRKPPERLIEPRLTGAAEGTRARKEKQPALDLEPSDDYQLPPLDLLDLAPAARRSAEINEDALAQNARLLESVLSDFGVSGSIIKVRPGPVVTMYELEPAPGTKTSRVIGLSDDIARSMSAVSVRVAVIPGRNVIGIELPNSRRETVHLRELLATDAYEKSASKLLLSLGKDISGQPIMVDLARMPHLLVAGTTGSGKSVAVNTMILSLLYRLSPDECKFIMIDPKMLELSVYDGIPHLIAPVVTEPAKAVVALKWTVKEMEERYRSMSKLGVRNITSYNQRLAEARKKGEVLTRTVQTGFDTETGKPIYEEQPLDLTHLPYIVVIVDEMADLMMVSGKDIEAAIQRLAQMARAAGIHIIMATQRPSVDVITGTIKANFPTRISFQVTSRIDSRTILSEPGAEQLLGQGDMLYMAGGGRITRVHGPLVTDKEVDNVVAFLSGQGAPSYIDSITEVTDADLPGMGGNGGDYDALYDDAVALVCRERKASTSFVQRHLQIGYNRAARIIDQMERDGVISAANHVGKREILAPDGPS